MMGRAFSMTTSFAALALALGLVSARAEDMDHSKMDHSAHGAAAPAPTQWADPGKAQQSPAAEAPRAEAPKADEHAGHHGGGMSGGMGGGMMGGMGGGMMGGMNQGGSGGGMSGMNHGGSGGGMGGMMQHMLCGFTEHLDGRLAYMKAELKLTDSQTGAWSNFADAWRELAQKANAKCASMDDRMDHAKPHVLHKLDMMESHMSTHLDIIRAQRAAIETLFNALSEDQKKVAGEVLSSIMKVGGSMMGGGGMMGGMNHGGSGGGMSGGGMGGMQH